MFVAAIVRAPVIEPWRCMRNDTLCKILWVDRVRVQEVTEVPQTAERKSGKDACLYFQKEQLEKYAVTGIRARFRLPQNECWGAGFTALQPCAALAFQDPNFNQV